MRSAAVRASDGARETERRSPDGRTQRDTDAVIVRGCAPSGTLQQSWFRAASMMQQDRQIGGGQDVSGGASEDDFAETAMGVSTHNKEIGARKMRLG
jgi:hypothetical protein